ncbi:MAG: hypothetical protein GX417_02580 [Clostridiales bacterium]|nr:hypothetical protein [Clostridiales bacterium]
MQDDGAKKTTACPCVEINGRLNKEKPLKNIENQKDLIDTAPLLWYLLKVPRKGARFMMF